MGKADLDTSRWSAFSLSSASDTNGGVYGPVSRPRRRKRVGGKGASGDSYPKMHRLLSPSLMSNLCLDQVTHRWQGWHRYQCTFLIILVSPNRTCSAPVSTHRFCGGIICRCESSEGS